MGRIRSIHLPELLPSVGNYLLNCNADFKTRNLISIKLYYHDASIILSYCNSISNGTHCLMFVVHERRSRRLNLNVRALAMQKAHYEEENGPILTIGIADSS